MVRSFGSEHHPDGGAARTASTKRAILATDGDITLATLLSGEQECVDARCESTFDEDPDDRPVLIQPPERRAAVLDVATEYLLGTVAWRPVTYGGTAAATAWNIGIRLLPAARGRGRGTSAARLLVQYLFATTEVDRVEANTDVANMRGRRGLEKAGFQWEGVLRGVHVRGGARRDMAMYSMLRTDVAG